MNSLLRIINFLFFILIFIKTIVMEEPNIINRMKNLNEKTSSRFLSVTSRQYEPYMYRYSNGSFYRGIEYMLHLIRTKDYKENSPIWGPISAGSYSNLPKLKYMDMNNSDVCIGGLFPQTLGLAHMTMSTPYISDEFTWCIQKAHLFPKYLTPFRIAPPEAWLGLLFLFGFGSGYILYLMIQFDKKYAQRNNRDWHYTTLLTTLSATIGMSARFYPSSSIVRIYYTFMLIVGIFGCQIANVFFLQFLQFRIYYHQIATIDELIENNFRLVGSEEVFSIIAGSKKYRHHQIESFHICDNTNDCIKDLIEYDDIAVGGSRQNILNSDAYSPSKVYCFHEEQHISTYSVALYMQPSFYLQPHIDNIIQNLFEAGLFVKWNADSRKRRSYEIPNSFSPTRRFSMSDISWALIFVIGCCTLASSACFICEQIVFRKIKQGNTNKVWIYLDQFVDGYRHYLKDIPENLAQK